MDDFLENLFQGDPAPKHSYEITFDASSTEELFDKISNIYIKGCSVLCGNNDSFNIFDVSEPVILKMKLHMQSLGIKTLMYEYKNKEVHDLFMDFHHEFCMELQNQGFTKRDFMCIFRRNRFGHIVNALWDLKNNEVRNLFTKTIHRQIHYQNIIELKEPKIKLKQYAYRIRTPEKLVIVRFDII